jgi:hypothetical protein
MLPPTQFLRQLMMNFISDSGMDLGPSSLVVLVGASTSDMVGDDGLFAKSKLKEVDVENLL